MRIISLILLSAMSGSAFAATTIATVADGLIPQLGSVAPLLGVLAYIFGLFLGFKGVLKLKEHNESKGQVKISVPIILLISSAMLLALPTFINVGITTLGFDKGSQSTFKY